MGRSATKVLSAKYVESITKVGYTADGKQPGLNLQVAKGLSGFVKSWVFRYTSPITGKRRELGLGSLRNISLAEARDKAAATAKTVHSGIDPKDERDKQRSQRRVVQPKLMTFEEAAKQCIAALQHEWKNDKHKHQWFATLQTYAFPSIGNLSPDQVTTDLILEVLDPIWTTKTTTATRLRQRIETVMDWAKAKKLYSGDNPASLKGGLGQLLPKANKIAKVKHQPSLPYVQIHSFLQGLRSKKGVSPKALEFLILTATRSGDILGAKWSEIDEGSKVWTIPAERMKAGREHRVPLSPQAMVIITEMKKAYQCEYIFPGPTGKKGMSNGALLALMKGMPAYATYVPHGFRSTFRDWAAETTSFANETLELALAHSIRDKTEAAYRRLDQIDKRAKLMEQWADYIERAPHSASVAVIGKSK